MSHQELPRRRRIEHLQRRHPVSTPRRRTSDPKVRRRKEDHKKANGPLGAALTVTVALLFLAYVFDVAGFATVADHFFSSLNTSAQAQNAEVVSLTTLALPILGIIVAVLILFGIFSWIASGLKRSGKNRRLAGREVITIEHFRELAGHRDIRPRIATHAYTLLLPFYHRHMRVRLEDRLHEDLHMSDMQIADLLGNLLRATDRKPSVGSSSVVVTVMDLLQTVQDSPRNFLQETAPHKAAEDRKLSYIRPVKRNFDAPPASVFRPESPSDTPEPNKQSSGV
jgi:hypothetical protein